MRARVSLPRDTEFQENVLIIARLLLCLVSAYTAPGTVPVHSSTNYNADGVGEARRQARLEGSEEMVRPEREAFAALAQPKRHPLACQAGGLTVRQHEHEAPAGKAKKGDRFLGTRCARRLPGGQPRRGSRARE